MSLKVTGHQVTHNINNLAFYLNFILGVIEV